jgi:thiol:disulfide interchange protein DsbA
MRKTVIRLLSAFCAYLLVFGLQVQAQTEKLVPYQEGLHYFLINQAPAVTDGEMELVEAFSYLCTHCNTFEPYIDNWKRRKPAHVGFSRIPVVFGRNSWELYARGYVTAKMLNLPEEAHAALMERLWKEKKIIRNMDELAAFYSQFGVEKDRFISTSKSFAVDSKIRKDQMLVKEYGITGTPSLVLNGKYRIAGNAAVPSFEVMLDIVDYLIEMDTEGQ